MPETEKKTKRCNEFAASVERENSPWSSSPWTSCTTTRATIATIRATFLFAHIQFVKREERER